MCFFLFPFYLIYSWMQSFVFHSTLWTLMVGLFFLRYSVSERFRSHFIVAVKLDVKYCIFCFWCSLTILGGRNFYSQDNSLVLSSLFDRQFLVELRTLVISVSEEIQIFQSWSKLVHPFKNRFEDCHFFPLLYCSPFVSNKRCQSDELWLSEHAAANRFHSFAWIEFRLFSVCSCILILL